MALDERIRSLLESREPESDPAAMTLQQLRERARESIARWHSAGVRDHDVASTKDIAIDLNGARRRIRVYLPHAAPQAGSPLPVVVYLHGGGWVLGDLDTHDGICRAICSVGSAIVVAVEYGLAPENPYPAPLLECEESVLWATENAAAMGGDPRALFIAGDSAGANLAAVCALRMRDRSDVRIAGQVLIYPAVDDPAAGHGSMEQFKVGHAYGQNHDLLCRMMKLYTGDRITLSHPDFAPLRAVSLAGAPPALVLTAEYDMLRDEGEAYADRLRTEGVEVALERVAGVNHGFMHLTNYLPATDAAFETIGQWIARHASGGTSPTAGTSQREGQTARL